MNYFYLHGWLSGPLSNKARFFNRKFTSHGLTLNIPDLNQNDFFHLTLSRQIEQVQSLLPAEPVTLIGSSFGALTALWVAENSPQVERLVLMAPAFNFSEKSLSKILTQSLMDQWKGQGQVNLEHYAYSREVPLSYNFVEDLRRYDDAHLSRRLPTLILHGLHDETIPVQASRNFAASRSWVKLVELDSDHGLASVQDRLWDEVMQFCGIV